MSRIRTFIWLCLVLVHSTNLIGQVQQEPGDRESRDTLKLVIHPAEAGLLISPGASQGRSITGIHFRGSFSANAQRQKGRGHVAFDFYRGQGLPMLRDMEAGFDRRYGQGESASRLRARWETRVLPSVILSIGRDTLHDGWGQRSLFRGNHVAPVPFFQTVIDGGGRVRYQHRIEALQGAPSVHCWTGEPQAGDPRVWTPPQGAIRSGLERMVVSHRIEVDFGRRLTGALWGAVVWNTADGQRNFEPHFLLPLTSLRPTEYVQGSSDNALVGMEGRMKVGALDGQDKYLFGQLLLDELIVAEILGSTGWWGNKFALLGGVCWNTPRGGWRVEVSGSRPWTYSHFTPTSAYINGLTPLAHPLGANFFEVRTAGQHQWKHWRLHGRFTASQRGDDLTGNAPTGSLPQIGDIDRREETYDWLGGTARHFLLAQVDLARALPLDGKGHLQAFARMEFQRTGMEGNKDDALRLFLGIRSTGPWLGADW